MEDARAARAEGTDRTREEPLRASPPPPTPSIEAAARPLPWRSDDMEPDWSAPGDSHLAGSRDTRLAVASRSRDRSQNPAHAPRCPQHHTARQAIGARVTLSPRVSVAAAARPDDATDPRPRGRAPSRSPKDRRAKQEKHPKRDRHKKDKREAGRDRPSGRRRRSPGPPSPAEQRGGHGSPSNPPHRDAAAGSSGRPRNLGPPLDTCRGHRSRSRSEPWSPGARATRQGLAVSQRGQSHWPHPKGATRTADPPQEFPTTAPALLAALHDLDTQPQGGHVQCRRSLRHSYLEAGGVGQGIRVPSAHFRLEDGLAVCGEAGLALEVLEHALPTHLARGLHILIDQALDGALKAAMSMQGPSRRLFPFVAARGITSRPPTNEVPQLPSALQGLLAFPYLLDLPSANEFTNIALLVADHGYANTTHVIGRPSPAQASLSDLVSGAEALTRVSVMSLGRSADLVLSLPGLPPPPVTTGVGPFHRQRMRLGDIMVVEGPPHKLPVLSLHPPTTIGPMATGEGAPYGGLQSVAVIFYQAPPPQRRGSGRGR